MELLQTIALILAATVFGIAILALLSRLPRYVLGSLILIYAVVMAGWFCYGIFFGGHTSQPYPYEDYYHEEGQFGRYD